MAVTIETLTGQDSPNSGRLKVNTNFSNLKTVVDSHVNYLTALSGDVVSTDASQTIINKVITSVNATTGAGNTITIAKQDIDGNFFGVANTYSGIAVIDAKIHQIDKTNNTITISGFGGIEPTNDTINRVIGIGFPQNAYLDHPNGSQSLVINDRTRTGAAVLDVNGLTTLRSSLEIGDASDGTAGANTILHINDGLDGSSRYSDVNFESRGSATADEGSYFNFMRNPNQTPVVSGQNLGTITFVGNYGNGATTYNPAKTATRITGTALATYASGDRQAAIDFYADKGGSATAERIMRIAGGHSSNEGGAGVIIGRSTADTGATRRAVLTIANSFTGSYNDLDNDAVDLALLNGGDVGISMVTSGGSPKATINYQKENTKEAAMIYSYVNDKFSFTQNDSTDATLTINVSDNRVGIGPNSVTPLYDLEVHGSSGTPSTASVDVLRINHTSGTGLTSGNPPGGNDLTGLYATTGKIHVLQIAHDAVFNIKHNNKTPLRLDDSNGLLQLKTKFIRFSNEYDGYNGDFTRNGVLTLHNLQGASTSGPSGSILSANGRWYYQNASEIQDAQSTISEIVFDRTSGNLNGGMDSFIISTAQLNGQNPHPKIRIAGKEGTVHLNCTSDGYHAHPGRQHQGAAGTLNSGLKAGVVTYGGVLMSLGSLNSLPSSTGLGDNGLLFCAPDGNYFGTNLDAKTICIMDGNQTSNNTADGGLVIKTGSHAGGFGLSTRAIASFRLNQIDKPQVRFGFTDDEIDGTVGIQDFSVTGTNNYDYTVMVNRAGNGYGLGVAGDTRIAGVLEVLYTIDTDQIRLGSAGANMSSRSADQSLYIKTSTADPATSACSLIQDTRSLNSVRRAFYGIEQTGSGTAKRTVGMSLTTSGTSTIPGKMEIGQQQAKQGGTSHPDIIVDIKSTAGMILPRGTNGQRPGGANSDYTTPDEGTVRYNTDSSMMEFYNGSQWVTAGAPPVGSTFLQYGPSNLDNSPQTLYPGTTWVTGDVPANYFIRSVGDDHTSQFERGARPYMFGQVDMVPQHTHRTTSVHGSPRRWTGGSPNNTNSDGLTGTWAAPEYPATGSFYASSDDESRMNYSYYKTMKHSLSMGTAWYGDDTELIWEASETFNNGRLDDLSAKGVETGRVVHHRDRRTPVNATNLDSDGFDPIAGAGFVKSFGGSNGVGGFWAGYIGANNHPYAAGKECRPINVAIKFWRRTA